MEVNESGSENKSGRVSREEDRRQDLVGRANVLGGQKENAAKRSKEESVKLT